MPLKTGKDKNGSYYKWGSMGNKYYYVTGNATSRSKAKSKAMLQARAIESSKSRAKKGKQIGGYERLPGMPSIFTPTSNPYKPGNVFEEAMRNFRQEAKENHAIGLEAKAAGMAPGVGTAFKALTGTGAQLGKKKKKNKKY